MASSLSSSSVTAADLPAFPVIDLLPKKATTALSFLSKFPRFDGRGVTIAVFDTGVDPAAAGLTVTSDSRAKVIGLHDASGDGDVDTSAVGHMEEETRVLTGVTGRRMRIPESWSCPSGDFHMGIIAAYHLFPGREQVRQRSTVEYKDRSFDGPQGKAAAAAAKSLSDFNDRIKGRETGLSQEEKLQREELQATSDLVTGFANLTDYGPSFDVLVWQDGQSFNVVIDTQADLSQATILQSFSECLKYGTISPNDRVSYAVNVHEEGNRVEVVSMTGSHGTHVACIAAANFPDEPEKNGVAPGAQIVSIGIGSQAMSSMETTNALTRAVITCSKLKVDIINMSFGEFAHWTGGPVMQHLENLVHEFGIIFCVSAGNNGPALTTIGTPPMSQSNAFIGIGAYVTPDMMESEYSMRSKLPGMSFTWTSRGPNLTGDMGIHICAPGAAVTSVPEYSRCSSRLMNGTSMACPNAVGSIALLISALKQEDIAYSPYSIRTAVQNTALKVNNYDRLAMGHGMIQVTAAYEHLKQQQNLIERDVRFEVSVGTSGRGQGIYQRVSRSDISQNLIAKLHSVTVTPVFLKDKDRDPEDKIRFSMNLILTCDADWVTAPKLLSLSFSARSFGVKVDADSGLETGVHSTLVHGYDSRNVGKGPVFSVPVTLIIGEDIKSGDKAKVRDACLKGGQVLREFVKPPSGATAVTVTVKNKSQTEDAHLVLHTMQIVEQKQVTHQQKKHTFGLIAGTEAVFWIPVRDDCLMEVALAQWWSSLTEANISMELSFTGIGIKGGDQKSPITMRHSAGIQRIEVCSPLSLEAITPSVSLETVEQVVKPVDHKITPLPLLYSLPLGDKPLYENKVTYSLILTRASEVSLSSPPLSHLLYESPLTCSILFLYDGNKRLVTATDFKKHPEFTKLDKGEYTIVFHGRHESVKPLERLSDLPLVLTTKLPANISLDCYGHEYEALTEGKKVTTIANVRTGPGGQAMPLFLTSITGSKVPKGVTLSPGMTLKGSISLTKEDKKKKATDILFQYLIDADINPVAAVATTTTSSPAKNSNGKSGKGGEENEIPDAKSEDRSKYEEALAELAIQWISRSKDSVLTQELVSSARKLAEKKKEPSSGTEGSDAEPGDRQLLIKVNLATIQSLQANKSSTSVSSDSTAAVKTQESQSGKGSQGSSDQLLNEKVIRLADEILSQTDVTHLLGRLESAKVDSSTPESIKKIEKEKSQVMELLVRKGIAILDQIERRVQSPDDAVISASDGPLYRKQDVDDIYFQLVKLTKGDVMTEAVSSSVSNGILATFVERHGLLRHEVSRVIRLWQRLASESKVVGSNRDTEKKIIAIIRKERPEWNHVADFLERGIDARFPPAHKIL